VTLTPRRAVWIAVMDERRRGTLARQSHQPRVQEGFEEDELGHQVRAVVYGQLGLIRGSKLEKRVLEYALLSSGERGVAWYQDPDAKRAQTFVDRRLRRALVDAGIMPRYSKRFLRLRVRAAALTVLRAWDEDGHPVQPPTTPPNLAVDEEGDVVLTAQEEEPPESCPRRPRSDRS